MDKNYDTSESGYALIDHMHYQNDNSIAGEWLFGTTRDRRVNSAGSLPYVWRLDLDPSTKNPRGNNLLLKKLDKAKFPNASHIIGVRPKMNGNIMSMIYWNDSANSIYFLQVELS